MGRSATAGDKRMKQRTVALPFLDILQIGIGRGAAQHILFAGIFEVAHEELEAEFGDSLEWVTDLAEVKGYGRMGAKAFDAEITSSLGQLVEEGQAVPGGEFGEYHPVFLVGNGAYVAINSIFALSVHILVHPRA